MTYKPTPHPDKVDDVSEFNIRDQHDASPEFIKAVNKFLNYIIGRKDFITWQPESDNSWFSTNSVFIYYKRSDGTTGDLLQPEDFMKLDEFGLKLTAVGFTYVELRMK